MKWDGYGAYLQPEKSITVRGVLAVLADAFEVNPTPGPQMRRWGQTTAFEVGDRMAAWVGTDTAGGIYIEGKGETSPKLVDAIRRRFPDHGAARLDVAEDYAGAGAFERLQALVRANKGVKVKGGYVALPDDPEDGRTYAAGARGGVGYIRVYEPGKMKERAGLFAPDAARAELEARPHYARDKRAAACMSPVDVWGITAWTRNVGNALMQCELARYEPVVRKYSYDKTTRYIATTFRRHLEEMFANGEDFARTCAAIWEEEDSYARH